MRPHKGQGEVHQAMEGHYKLLCMRPYKGQGEVHQSWQWRGIIRGVASLEGDNLLVFK